MTNPFLKEIHSWNWKWIVSSAKNDPEVRDEDGGTIGRTYLGSIFSLTPSGKYYTPFACSNVDECPNCYKGSGILHQSAKGRRREKKWEAKRKQLIHRFDVARRGGFGETHLIDKSTAVMQNLERFRPETCQRCGGLGSAEAHDDERWHEALEKVAGDHGGWIENGESGEYIFFAMDITDEGKE